MLTEKDKLIKKRDSLITVVNYLHNAYLLTKLDDIHDLYIESLYALWRLDDDIREKGYGYND